jgi:hypothetical protein
LNSEAIVERKRGVERTGEVVLFRKSYPNKDKSTEGEEAVPEDA